MQKDFPELRLVRFYPTFGENITKYFKPYSWKNKVSLAFGASVFQDDVMGITKQRETVRALWDVLSPGGIFTYCGDSKGFFKIDLMSLISKEEFLYFSDKFNIYIKSLPTMKKNKLFYATTIYTSI